MNIRRAFIYGILVVGITLLFVAFYQSTSKRKARQQEKKPSGWTELTSNERDRLRSLGFTPTPKPNLETSLRLKTLSGEDTRLAEWNGRWVLINFWATWCMPCRVEMPSLQRLHDRLSAQPFSVVGINMDESPGKIRSFLNEEGVRFPIRIDPSGKLGEAFRVNTIPETWLLDPHGHPVAGYTGPREWDSSKIVSLIQSLMGGEIRGST
ncbi:MAG: TlpA family protein disulfide reductase [bacterium]